MKKTKKNPKYPDLIPWEEVRKEWHSDPEYVLAWKKQEPHYQMARQIIGARLKKNWTQAQLAEKVGTGQAVISRLEGGNAKPTITLLQRIASALETELHLTIR